MTGSTIGSARERAVVAIGIAGLVVGTSALVGSAVAAQPVPTCFGAPATAVGTPNADVLVGTSGIDVIVGGGGDDRIRGVAGNDLLCGGPGHDDIVGGHNRVVDTLPASVPAAQRFATARDKVVRHYQWMLRTDYLPRICAPSVVNDVFARGRKAFEVGVPATAVPTMPIEFSIAAFRLGHSMVRQAYNWNVIFDNGGGTLDLLFTFSAGSGNLGGERRLQGIWIADFRRLYDFAEAGRADLTVPANKFNRAQRIDTRLVPALASLPGFPAAEANLAFRNLTRASMVNLATGQQMARFLRNKGVNLTPLTNAQIRNGSNGADLENLTRPQRTALLQNTPLWFYILREAELNGGRLNGVGARIVAETFHRAIEGSHTSIVRDPAWRPSLGPNNQTFRMVDLLLFAFRGRRNLLNPVGD